MVIISRRSNLTGVEGLFVVLVSEDGRDLLSLGGGSMEGGESGE